MNQNKLDSMDAVGELPDLGNLLLREFGYPHLPDPVFVPEPKQSQSDAWNDAGTKPDHPCLCETRLNDNPPYKIYQYWAGTFFGATSQQKNIALQNKIVESILQDVQWREVQP
jgi:hypothetical protein